MILTGRDYDEITGITTEYWTHLGGKKVTVRRLQNVEPHLDLNRARMNSCSSKSKSHLRKAQGYGAQVASIPMGFVEEHLQKTGVNLISCSTDQLHRVLNDPNFQRLRVAHGRI